MYDSKFIFKMWRINNIQVLFVRHINGSCKHMLVVFVVEIDESKSHFLIHEEQKRYASCQNILVIHVLLSFVVNDWLKCMTTRVLLIHKK